MELKATAEEAKTAGFERAQASVDRVLGGITIDISTLNIKRTQKMSTRNTHKLLTLLSFFPLLFGIHEVQADEIRDRLIGRQGNCSEDGRQRGVLGCSGNTYEATVSINKVEVSGNKITVNYDGKYNRDKFDTPCIKTANEQRHVFGSHSFELKPGRIVWGAPSNFGEVTDAGHDSNRFAFCAAKDAVNSAMQ